MVLVKLVTRKTSIWREEKRIDDVVLSVVVETSWSIAAGVFHQENKLRKESWAEPEIEIEKINKERKES